jgi:hypothetical protein
MVFAPIDLCLAILVLKMEKSYNSTHWSEQIDFGSRSIRRFDHHTNHTLSNKPQVLCLCSRTFAVRHSRWAGEPRFSLLWLLEGFLVRYVDKNDESQAQDHFDGPELSALWTRNELDGNSRVHGFR